jgi:hypothetical protein
MRKVEDLETELKRISHVSFSGWISVQYVKKDRNLASRQD